MSAKRKILFWMKVNIQKNKWKWHSPKVVHQMADPGATSSRQWNRKTNLAEKRKCQKLKCRISKISDRWVYESTLSSYGGAIYSVTLWKFIFSTINIVVVVVVNYLFYFHARIGLCINFIFLTDYIFKFFKYCHYKSLPSYNVIMKEKLFLSFPRVTILSLFVAHGLNFIRHFQRGTDALHSSKHISA